MSRGTGPQHNTNHEPMSHVCPLDRETIQKALLAALPTAHATLLQSRHPVSRQTQGRARTRTAVLGMALLIVWIATPRVAGAKQQVTKLGPVTATVTLTPEEPVIGDTLTLRLEVVAEKDVELLMPDFGEALDRFTIVDFVPREELDDQGQTRATQLYRLQTPSSGKHAIPPILIEFVDRRPGKQPSPDDYDAYELLTERVEFEVQSVAPQAAASDLKNPLGRLDPLPSQQATSWPWYVLGGCLLLAAASTPWIWKWIRARRKQARRRSAYDLAWTRLQKLIQRPLPEEGEVDSFYVELSSIVRRYLEDRFELRAPELTTEEFLNSIGQSSELSREHQSLLREFLKQADLVKFAGIRPTADVIEASLAAARSFLEETRENAPLIEVTDPADPDAHAANPDPSNSHSFASREGKELGP